MASFPRPSRGAPRLAGLIAATAALALPASALATPSLTVSGTIDLGPDALPFYDQLTVTSTGKIVVKAFAKGSTSSTGWLVIKANNIIVQQGGVITADGAGYTGVDGMAGLCQLGFTTPGPCAGAGSAAGQPGGGGGCFGAGADGTTEADAGTCTDLGSMSAGGAAFWSATTMKLDLGSAGGASNLSNPALTAGAAGGGGIRLSAAVVQIDGTVTANGADANPFNGVGPGGGSGGVIEITAATIKGAGTLSVKGGKGAHGTGISGVLPANNGGGGSGGVVLLHLPSGGTSPLTVVTTGGSTGDCTTLPGASGGSAMATMTSDCVDVDGDGYTSSQCGGMDCDDSDPNIHPGAAEICNGVDDNCSGKVDEAPNNCTDAGEVCETVDGGGMCVAPPSDGGTGGSSAPTYIQYGGGCWTGAAVPSVGGGALAAAVVALSALSRRRRRSR